MWPFRSKRSTQEAPPTILLTNTRSGKKEPFIPLKPGHVLMYSCGPTVYSRAHIGNLRSYVFADTLARMLYANGYKVRRVINITDVGHLTGDNEGDADAGEDRMEKSARTEGLAASEIADRYTKQFLDDIRALHIDTNQLLLPKATQYIPEQIALIQELEKRGHTYRTADGIYFDTGTFPTYGALGGKPQGQSIETLESRIGLVAQKRHPRDFALWKFSPAGVKRQQEWQSPWGRGFPGWHIECSAMSKALLGAELDIHTGGIDHIPVHHTNEIAQSEAITGRPLARYWLHGAFLTVKEERIGKSMGNALYLSDLEQQGIHPLALRYLFLQAHYRSPLSFTWEGITAANEALTKMWRYAREIKAAAKEKTADSKVTEQFAQFMRDDLASPRAIALLWETLKNETLSARATWGLLQTAESYLGLSLTNPPHPKHATPATIPADIQSLVQQREEARQKRDFATADTLRIHIEERGYRVEDSPSGPVVVRALVR